MAPSGMYSAAWRQFLSAKQKMLDEYDHAMTHAKRQKVKTHHGNVGEAGVRAWLEEFLPKRFGVTPGYIRSQGPKGHQSSHFDVIVYDQLESPTLWIEENKDKSNQGRSRYIPAEYVLAILEVKAAFNKRNVKDAIKKLRELAPLVEGVDAPKAPYPRFLPKNVVLGTMFFELRKSERQKTISTLEEFRLLDLGRPFYGGVVLRGEGLPKDVTGIVKQTISDDASPALMPDARLLGGHVMTASVKSHRKHHGAMLDWSGLNFANFAFDLVAILNGSYRPGFSSSWHGLDFIEGLTKDM